MRTPIVTLLRRLGILPEVEDGEKREEARLQELQEFDETQQEKLKKTAEHIEWAKRRAMNEREFFALLERGRDGEKEN